MPTAALLAAWKPICVVVFVVVQTLLLVIDAASPKTHPAFIGCVLLAAYIITVTNIRVAAIVCPSVLLGIVTAYHVQHNR